MKKKLLACLMLVFLFSACTADIDTTFYKDQSWKTDVVLTYDSEYRELIDNAEDFVSLFLYIDEGFEIGSLFLEIPDISEWVVERIDDVIKASLDGMTAYYSNQQIHAIYEIDQKKSEEVISINISGREYKTFEALVPGDAITVTTNSDESIRIEGNFTEINQYLAFAGFVENVRIHGSEFIASNHSYEKNDYVQWINPSLLDVTFKPKRPPIFGAEEGGTSSFGLFLGLGIGALLILGILYYLVFIRK